MDQIPNGKQRKSHGCQREGNSPGTLQASGEGYRVVYSSCQRISLLKLDTPGEGFGQFRMPGYMPRRGNGVVQSKPLIERLRSVIRTGQATPNPECNHGSP